MTRSTIPRDIAGKSEYSSSRSVEALCEPLSTYRATAPRSPGDRPTLRFVVEQDIQLGQVTFGRRLPETEVHFQKAPEQIRTAQIGIDVWVGARLELSEAVEDVVVVRPILRQMSGKLQQLTVAITLPVDEERSVFWLELPPTVSPVLLYRVEELRVVGRDEELPAGL